MAMVLNKSKERMEKAEQEYCPRCDGFGRVVGDDVGCFLCKGYGYLWVSVEDTGWTRAMYARINNSELY